MSGQARGFALLEAMLAGVILTITLGVLALTASRDWSRSQDGDVLARLENAVAADLGWLKTYARYWRMSSGPYNLTCTQAGFGASCSSADFTFSTTTILYDPVASRCATATGLAQDFINTAASVRLTLSPPGPYTIPTVPTDGTSGSGTPNPKTDLAVTGLPSGSALYRTLRIGTSSSDKHLIYLSYSYEGTGASSYSFLREVALRPEASGWCP